MAQGRDLLRSGMPFMHQLPARWRPVNHPGDGYLLRCGHALRVPGRLLLAEHHVLQHLVDLPVLTAVKRSWNALRNREGRGLGAASGDRHSSSSQGLPSVGGDTLTHNSTVTNAPKSPPLETNC
ncbi:hypothetical protein D910_07216 [Dendroctonus ponderosae]|uniref:Uncharacterized protein n=1 Tax=Dendroctonus ponderosae TaxID=77166 RepID=U4UA09_DENPD|nr:hypothetical protein D910_07216 [Dendroctonus ponderosae]